MIQRELYLGRIKKWIDTDVIKVITGIRRSGKTYFMNQIIDFLIHEKNIHRDNIIYIDKENLYFEFIKTYKDLHEYIEEKTKNIHGKNYVFIDEIQDIEAWEKTLRNYVKNPNFDIYITGSNSNVLSSELSSFLTGRYVEFHLYPLNFKEFLEFRGQNKTEIKSEFQNYIRYGGFPAIHKMEFTDEMIYVYLSGVFNSILFKDIVGRYGVRNTNLLVDVFKFTADNVGNIVSSKKITDYLVSQKIHISLDTLREYLTFFQNTFLLSRVQRYDLKGKKILDLLEKYYVGDLGFRNYLLGYRQNDTGQYLENLVYLELKVRGYDVCIGKIGDLEIDFIAKKDGKIEYYQVCYLLANDSTVAREFGNLEKIKDNYPKFVLSMDEIFTTDYNGIQRLNIIDWCLNE